MSAAAAAMRAPAFHTGHDNDDDDDENDGMMMHLN